MSFIHFGGDFVPSKVEVARVELASKQGARRLSTTTKRHLRIIRGDVMNYKMMGRFISLILFVEAVFMIPALGIGLFGCEWRAVQGFLVSIAACGGVAGILYWLCKGAPSAFYAKEGMVCVGFSWITLSLFGCLPFFISREIPQFVDAFFEVVSGFTTTGASVVANVEGLSKRNTSTPMPPSQLVKLRQ